MLGSIDSNTGDPLLGWDTDQFPMDIKKAALTMLVTNLFNWEDSISQVVVRQGGLAPGGLNFDCKVRRESTDVEDMFISHIGRAQKYCESRVLGAMDTFARGLRIAEKIIKDGVFDNLIKERYASFDSGLGKQVKQVVGRIVT